MSNQDRYKAAAHAMQTGVEFSRDKTDQSPKHLRVGINAAMADHGGLADLLIRKGIITKEEYLDAIADYMEREAAGYEQKIQGEAGSENIKLV